MTLTGLQPVRVFLGGSFVRLIAFIFLLTSLVACATIYRSPRITEGISGDSNVRVVPINGETTVQANRSPYTPKALPSVFNITAGDASSGTFRGAGALPEPPSTQDGSRGQLQLIVPPPVNPGPYTIGIGDVVVLATPARQNSVEELTGLLAAQNARQGYTVQDDGSVNIPDVGRVLIAGQTIDEAEAVLFRRLVEAQIEPSFSLEISEFNSRRVSIGGAVRKPGVVPITLLPLYLDEALAIAGSVNAGDIDVSSVRIYRDGKLYQIPLTSLYASADLQRTRLISGDSVFVDTEYQLDRAESYFQQQITVTEARREARAQALAELNTEISLRRQNLNESRQNFVSKEEFDAVDRDYVYLTGEVERQGRIALPYGRDAVLADAIFAEETSGLAKLTGDVSQIYVLRASNNPQEFGAVTAWHLDARNAANLLIATKFELRPGDVVFVAENPVTRWGRTIAQITPSLLTTAAAVSTN
ncbi:MAG: polysaccharide biosynthesis/export family protein [Paracoccaceae bacterium]